MGMTMTMPILYVLLAIVYIVNIGVMTAAEPLAKAAETENDHSSNDQPPEVDADFLPVADTDTDTDTDTTNSSNTSTDMADVDTDTDTTNSSNTSTDMADVDFGTSVPDANITSGDNTNNINNETTTVGGGLQEIPPSCESYHYNCSGCLQSSNGCYWCTYDSLCFSTPEFIPTQSGKNDLLFPNKIYSCTSPDMFTQKTCTSPENYFDDPMYGGQKWIFDMIKVEPVWKRGIYGKGVRVRINDEGIESSHTEFKDRIDFNASCDAEFGGLPVVEPMNNESHHGIVTASLVGAMGNNSVCGVGIAPMVTMSSCPSTKLIVNGKGPEMLTYKLDQMDISQNSWAVEACGKESNLNPLRVRHRERRNRKLQEEEEEDKENGIDDNDDSNSTTTLSPILQETMTPLVSTCPFKYIPFEEYKGPCLVCEWFENDNKIMDTKERMELLGDECINTIKNHCDFYYLEEQNQCMGYIDMILEMSFPGSNGECKFHTLSKEAREAFTRGVTEGRNGKGIIYVFASGNENRVGDDTNFQGYGSNTRMTIPVGAVGKDGKFSSYSTTGASVFISAPGGDPRKAYTTVIAAVNNNGCKDVGTGTSNATPIVSGVVALMLEANSDLGWRDVQDILARTAQPVTDDEFDTSLTLNHATPKRLYHSNRYGFGIVDADAAVNMSETHINLGPEQMLLGEGSGELIIYDKQPNQTATIANVTIDSSLPFETESVYVYVKTNHTSRGHLRIKLTSPKGTISTLTPGFRPEDQTDEWMKFTTVRNWGEDPNGNWSISLYDTLQGDVSNCSDTSGWRWQLYDDFSMNNTIYDQVITCEFNSDPVALHRFCSNGRINNEDGYYGQLCNDGVDKACDILNKFANDTYNNLTATDACCLCGGGVSPGALPDYLSEWKVAVYGHHISNTSTNITSELDTDDGSSGAIIYSNIIAAPLFFVATAAVVFIVVGL